ncbi:hypothetical protein TTHERM_00249840 (macronuclear) [Tetrahymena thermophila SB210]|uniref:Uncharacterized protein n=1 Tax=Tetrahymena thermophila (strain SB210) TaxID=312017 RepID=Q23QV0_TETTS|nr:hypothetical protein TTHERM_00249840 [Tetrahymena thermophila SB210]EAR98788.1 hypothetical protein TTHERM_00249840 [Tetrahymena thermophila SB210]|eukprot:XP_001019033.1 hypothetical protein TTHERM_00249840 [Tetrahymena thermophila SB210]
MAITKQLFKSQLAIIRIKNLSEAAELIKAAVSIFKNYFEFSLNLKVTPYSPYQESSR